MIPIVEAIADVRYQTVVWATGSQTSKTQGAVLNVIGQRMDDDPTPIMYVGPTKSFVTKKFEPRLDRMLRQVASLDAKLAKGKKSSKTSKLIGGIAVELAWAGSAAEVAGSPIGLAFVDERDRMKADVGGEGDPVELARTRGATYPRFMLVVTSSVTIGTVEVERNEASGLEHWVVADPKDVASATWRLWQEGARFEWAWPCPECDRYFIPRLRNLVWPKGATPAEAAREARLECPSCAARIPSSAKTAMNARGRYVAPGQSIERGGTVVGDPPDSTTASFWVSGLCSPWRSFGQAAERWLRAVRSGDPERMKTVLNTEFGELYRAAGEAPKWEVVANLREPYHFDELPGGVRVITAGVDVQKRGLYFVVRGWGYRLESWLLRHGYLEGETELGFVWDDLELLLTATTWGEARLPIRQMLVDSGYRPGDRWRRPEHVIYRWCRKFPGLARPSKGQETLDQPVKLAQLDVTVGNRKIKRAVELVHIDTGWAKDWIHGRIAAAAEGQDPTWHLPIDATDAYCAQVVAESRITTAAGRSKWIRTNRENHMLDCEVGALAAAHLLGVHLLRDEAPPPAPPAASDDGGRASWPVLGRARI